MAINSDVLGVDQYLQKLDRTVPLDMYITVHGCNLQRENKGGHNIHKEMPEVDENIIRIPGNLEHLSFDAIMATEPEYRSHAEYPFYSVLLQCDWIKSQILRVILKFTDPVESNICIKDYESKHFYIVGGARYIIRPINLVTQLISSTFHCLLVDLLNENNVIALFPNLIRLNVDLEALKRARMSPREGYVQREITNWKVEDKHLPPILETKGTSILMMLLRAHSFTISHNVKRASIERTLG